MGLQSFSHSVEYGALTYHIFSNNPLTRHENMMERILTDQTAQNNRPFCSNCQKPGHLVDNCFALWKCFSCNENGHMDKNCKKTEFGNRGS